MVDYFTKKRFSIDVLQDETAPAIALLTVLIKQYELSYLQESDPTFLREDIEGDFSVSISDLQADKIQAAINLVTTDTFFHDWRVFEVTLHAFCNNATDPDVLAPVSAEELVTGLAEVMLISTSILDDDEVLHFGDEVRAYAGKIFSDYGFYRAPRLFPTAIMPNTNKHDDKAENEALEELFDLRTKAILTYLDNVQ